MLKGRPVHLALVAACLVPFLWLVTDAVTANLGANPIETITHRSGDWTLRFLLLALAVTPARRIFRWNAIIGYRRTLGLFAFFYGSLHFATFVVLDHFFAWEAIVEDVVERPYVTAGFTGYACMLPLALTSTRGWIRRLGKRWSRLHRLVYVAAAAGVVHYLWLVKADLRPPLIYAGVLAVLLGIRAAFWLAGTRRGA